MVEELEGWLLDLFMDEPGCMKVWVKKVDGTWVTLRDKWCPHIYAHGLQSSLTSLASEITAACVDVNTVFEKKRVRLQDQELSNVLRINYASPARLKEIIDFVASLKDRHRISLYDVDIPAEQMYLYEKDLFPLAFINVEKASNKDEIRWVLQDRPNSVDYTRPHLKVLSLQVEAGGTAPLPTIDDPISRIMLHTSDGYSIVIDGKDDEEKILNMSSNVATIDPDIIVSERAGRSIFPYLTQRANAVGLRLNLGRDCTVAPSGKTGSVYVSYGQIYYKPPHFRFPGRIQIDQSCSFLFDECGIDGYIELTRTCRAPLQNVVHSAIGTVMKSAQLYVAVKEGILIPWRKREPENFKTAMELLTADRGGFYCDPKVGVFENVGELDFESLYPRLMVEYNISPETLNCSCCVDDEAALKIPMLDYHVCTRREGLVPKALRILVEQRDRLKKRWRETSEGKLKDSYDHRQSALKWVLVSCFGYLGFKNAKFGKIDAHIAVCALARFIMLKSIHIAEELGFEVIHGMVDSLWVRKPQACEDDFLALRDEIQQRTSLKISLEGLYRWIVFLPTKTKRGVAALNRYYGAFNDGKLKVRGLAVRRHDTPPIIAACQEEVLELLSTARSRRELVELLPRAWQTVEYYRRRLIVGDVQAHELASTTQLSQELSSYAVTPSHVAAARHLADAGILLQPGEQVRYVVVDARRHRNSRKALPLELIDRKIPYDRSKYLQHLNAAMDILKPITQLASREDDTARELF
ncbi:MAG: DNA polymerase domain-containing protein [Candidatus Bathyarchaeia archaeon]